MIKDVNNDVKALALVQGVAAMLDSLEVIIIAEGIENPDYLPLLEDAGFLACLVTPMFRLLQSSTTSSRGNISMYFT